MVRKPVFGKQSRTVRASAVSDKLSIDVDGVEMLEGGSDVAVSEDVQSLSKKLHALRRETKSLRTRRAFVKQKNKELKAERDELLEEIEVRLSFHVAAVC